MTRSRPRRYQVPDGVEGCATSITASHLRRASAEGQKKVMRAWFYANYRAPVDCCPYESAEGGYQFIYGGPYEAEEELRQEFEGIVRERVLEELADELDRISAEWTGPDSNADIDDYFFESLATSTGHRKEFERSIQDIQSLLSATVADGAQQCLFRILYVNVITALEAYLCDFFSSAVTEHLVLRRRFVEATPEFKNERIPLSDIFAAEEGLDGRVNRYLVEMVWHHLGRVIPMFRDTLGIKFPDEMGFFFKAVLVRHDLVHRNGRKKDGGEHVLQQGEVLTLIARCESLVEAIESQWEAAPAP